MFAYLVDWVRRAFVFAGDGALHGLCKLVVGIGKVLPCSGHDQAVNFQRLTAVPVCDNGGEPFWLQAVLCACAYGPCIADCR